MVKELAKARVRGVLRLVTAMVAVCTALGCEERPAESAALVFCEDCEQCFCSVEERFDQIVHEDDPARRRALIHRLRFAERKQAEDILRELITHPEPEVRNTAAAALRRLRHGTAGREPRTGVAQPLANRTQ